MYKFLMGTGKWLHRLTPGYAHFIAYGILAGTLLFDYYTGVDASFGAFYLAPVAILGWCAPFRAAVLISLCSSLAWEVPGVLDGRLYGQQWLYLWNFGSRFLIYLIIAFLLNQLRRAGKELARLSRTDVLTGVQNKAAFQQSLSDELNRQQRNRRELSLVYIDLDHFKEVNDGYGHLVGDQALQATVGVLLDRLRKTDIVGRLGGDEFAILMPETSSEGSQKALQPLYLKMLEAMDGLGLPITFSIGVVTSCDAMAPDELLNIADHLMYEVKHKGGNGIRYRELKPESGEPMNGLAANG